MSRRKRSDEDPVALSDTGTPAAVPPSSVEPPPAGLPELARNLSGLDEPPAPPVNLLAQDPQLIQDFLVEAREHLTNIEDRVLEIEQGAHTAETLHSAFRSFHTIKGLAGFLDFNVIQEVAHEVENLLDLARNNQLAPTPPVVDVVLQSGDYVGIWLNHIEAAIGPHPTPEPAAPAALIAKVKAVLANPQAPPAPAPAAAAPVELAAVPTAAAEFPLDDPPEAAPAPPPAPVAAVEEPKEPQQEAKAQRNEASLVKVETSKLEFLVDMVGELVIAQSMVRHNPELAEVKSPRLQRDIGHLSRVTAEVQKTAMAMRMVPIGQLFRRMTRLVRDLARKSGKLAELELFGEDVELDRNIVEELSDPLVHMLRNSMDHGLESPEERAAAGKSPCGTVRLRASHQAGQIVIEISDDGRGLNKERILAKAISRGLISADANLPDNEIYQLIFEPGFSTAEKITDVSGRGVGMDVVRKQVSKLRGRIEIVSTLGQGTSFFLKLPLTLAIIDGLVVVVGQERYIVPIFSVREMFKPTAEQLFTVEGRGEMALVREHLLPVVRLGRRLGVPARSEDACDGLMIVGESDGRTFCLLVDELVGKQEVVIKSLGSTFREVRGVAGGAILGDGRVGLILDLPTLIKGVAHVSA